MESLHPVVNFIYFAVVLGCSMVLMHPVCLAISFAAAFVYIVRMFGYVNANQKEFTKEQNEQYQSYYCGLCKELKQVAGAKGQMLLNYDMTFLTILLTGLYEPQIVKEKFVCPVHPVGKKVLRSSEATRYDAKMNVLLACQKKQLNGLFIISAIIKDN